MQHNSTIIIESKVAPGVRYTLHRKNEVRTAILARLSAESVERLQRFLAEARILADGPQEGFNSARFDALLSLTKAEVTTIGAAHVLAFLQGTDGLLIDGKPPTPTEFMVNAPDALRQECLTAIQQLLSGMTAEQHPFEFQPHAGPVN